MLRRSLSTLIQPAARAFPSLIFDRAAAEVVVLLVLAAFQRALVPGRRGARCPVRRVACQRNEIGANIGFEVLFQFCRCGVIAGTVGSVFEELNEWVVGFWSFGDRCLDQKSESESWALDLLEWNE